MSEYERTINTLKSMNRTQLLEMFIDINDIDIVEYIADCASTFVAKQHIMNCKSHNQDAKELDDLQRYRDIKFEQERR